jgi:hypothetical protein
MISGHYLDRFCAHVAHQQAELEVACFVDQMIDMHDPPPRSRLLVVVDCTQETGASRFVLVLEVTEELLQTLLDGLHRL